jgi:hypothetical protein
MLAWGHMEKDSKYWTCCCVFAVASMVMKIKFYSYNILGPGELSSYSDLLQAEWFGFQIPVEVRDFLLHRHPDWPWGPPSLLCNGYQGFFTLRGGGIALTSYPPSSAEVELFCYSSVLVWHVVGRTLPLIVIF